MSLRQNKLSISTHSFKFLDYDHEDGSDIENEGEFPIMLQIGDGAHSFTRLNDLRNASQWLRCWRLFTTVKSNVSNGARLENLSWRLWRRSSFLQTSEQEPRSPQIQRKVLEKLEQEAQLSEEISHRLSPKKVFHVSDTPPTPEHAPQLEPVPSDSKAPEPLRKTEAQHNLEKLMCANCGTSDTPLWRKDENRLSVCNACGLYRRLNSRDRPVNLNRSHIVKKRRPRQTHTVKPSYSSFKAVSAGKANFTKAWSNNCLAYSSSLALMQVNQLLNEGKAVSNAFSKPAGNRPFVSFGDLAAASERNVPPIMTTTNTYSYLSAFSSNQTSFPQNPAKMSTVTDRRRSAASWPVAHVDTCSMQSSGLSAAACPTTRLESNQYRPKPKRVDLACLQPSCVQPAVSSSRYSTMKDISSQPAAFIAEVASTTSISDAYPSLYASQSVPVSSVEPAETVSSGFYDVGSRLAADSAPFASDSTNSIYLGILGDDSTDAESLLDANSFLV